MRFAVKIIRIQDKDHERGKMMLIPEYLKNGDWIGVTAMSHPVDDEIKQYRFNHGANLLAKAGFGAVFTNNVFKQADAFGRSGNGQEKAYEFNALVKEDNVKAIFAASGGADQVEMLPYVDLELFRSHPKWVQGYSDNTAILHYLTTKADVATAYGCNFSDFGMDPWDDSVKRGLDILKGDQFVQTSFYKYQDGFKELKTGLEPYSKDEKVFWKVNAGNAPVDITGRLIGGCMDVLLSVAGTRFDGTLEYIEKYRSDGIIWYLESFDLGCEKMMEGLWKLKELGWFDGAVCIIFGRPMFYDDENVEGKKLPSYEEVVEERLAELNIPLITGADIGHKGPQFVMINGAVARVEVFKDGSARMTYIH